MQVEELERRPKRSLARKILCIVVAAVILVARIYPMVRTLTQNLRPEEQREMLSFLAVLCSAFLLLMAAIRIARK